MGVYLDKNGTWFVNKSWTDTGGKRHFKTKRGFKTKKEGQLFEAELILQIKNNVYNSDNPRFSSYFHEWVKTYKGELNKKTNAVRPNTLREYLLDEKRIIYGLANLKIKDITRFHYQNFINEFGQSHAQITVKKLNNHIRACVKYAIEDGLIQRDFTKGVQLSFNPKNTRQLTYLEDYQLKQLLHHLLKIRNSNYSGVYMIITIMYTGLRESEAAGLTWDCVNFDNLTLNINKAWDYKQKDYSPTKNKSSQRIIGMSPKLASLLKELKDNHPTKVFWSKSYQTLPQSRSLIDTLRRSLKELNINASGVHIHSLRHSQVAILLNADINIYDIAQRLGHEDIKTTQKIYAYQFKKHQAKINQKINQALDAI